MNARRLAEDDPLVVRSNVVNWLLTFGGVGDLPAVSRGADIGAIDRARYERRLDLLPGALSIGRFPKDFPGMAVEEIGAQLLDEAYLGTMQRVPLAVEEPEIEETDIELDPEQRFIMFTRAVGLEPSSILMLTGSPDVALAFGQWGVVTPELRRQPGHTDFSRFGLAIIGRGQAGHKQFEPWTQAIKNYETHIGPTLMTSPSSNLSGILTFLWDQRDSIRRYVIAWNARHE